MSDDDRKVPQVNSWAELLQGGLPQLLAGPAGKAISRLVAGATDIPAAWLEQKAQGIRDTTEARTKVMQTLSAKSAELGLSDPKLLERGLDNLLGRAYRDQQNREAVAREAVKQLEEDPAPESSAGPSDDWLNVFEEHASRASSEQLRETWARVLAGEIRKPSSYSLLTLQFLSTLDQETALAAKRRLGIVVGDLGMVVGSATGQRFMDLKLLRDSGLVSTLGFPDVETTLDFGAHGVSLLSIGTQIYVLRGKVEQKVKVQANSISRVARELLPVIGAEFQEDDRDALLKQLKAIDAISSIEPTLDSKDHGGKLTINWRRES